MSDPLPNATMASTTKPANNEESKKPTLTRNNKSPTGVESADISFDGSSLAGMEGSSVNSPPDTEGSTCNIWLQRRKIAAGGGVEEVQILVRSGDGVSKPTVEDLRRETINFFNQNPYIDGLQIEENNVWIAKIEEVEGNQPNVIVFESTDITAKLEENGKYAVFEVFSNAPVPLGRTIQFNNASMGLFMMGHPDSDRRFTKVVPIHAALMKPKEKVVGGYEWDPNNKIMGWKGISLYGTRDETLDISSKALKAESNPPEDFSDEQIHSAEFEPFGDPIAHEPKKRFFLPAVAMSKLAGTSLDETVGCLKTDKTQKTDEFGNFSFNFEDSKTKLLEKPKRSRNLYALFELPGNTDLSQYGMNVVFDNSDPGHVSLYPTDKMHACNCDIKRDALPGTSVLLPEGHEMNIHGNEQDRDEALRNMYDDLVVKYCSKPAVLTLLSIIFQDGFCFPLLIPRFQLAGMVIQGKAAPVPLEMFHDDSQLALFNALTILYEMEDNGDWEYPKDWQRVLDDAEQAEYTTDKMSAECKAHLVDVLNNLLEHCDGEDMECISPQLQQLESDKKSPLDYVLAAKSFLEEKASLHTPEALDLPSTPDAQRKPKSDAPGSNTSKDSKKSESSEESGLSSEQSTGSKEN